MNTNVTLTVRNINAGYDYNARMVITTPSTIELPEDPGNAIALGDVSASKVVTTPSAATVTRTAFTNGATENTYTFSVNIPGTETSKLLVDSTNSRSGLNRQTIQLIFDAKIEPGDRQTFYSDNLTVGAALLADLATP